MEKLLKFFAKDRLVINLLLLIILGFGIYNAFNLKREIFPDTEMNSMRIRIRYSGASATDVELNALIPVENVIDDISGIADYTSIASDGSASIYVELDEDVTDIQAVKDEIYRKVSISTISGLSDDVDSISVSEMDIKRKPVLRLALVAKDEKNERKDLFAMSDVMEDVLSKVEGVSSVSKSGYLDRKIFVEVNPGKLDSYHLSILDIVNAIGKRNVRTSSGTLQSVKRNQNIITVGQFDDPMDVKDVIVRSGFELSSIKVKDIAKVIDGYEDTDTKILVNGLPSVFLTVRKKENADTITTVENIQKFLNENKNIYGENYTVETISDDAVSIRSLLNVVIINAIIGFILVFIVLKVFLDLRTSFWTAFSIPVCLMIVFSYMSYQNITLNIITLGAFITVLGMLVDDAIVIAETIYVKKEQGMKPLKASVEGVKEVIAPVTITIASTIIAFLPMMFITGRMGKFIAVFPLIITVTLIGSLFEAVTILPNHLAHSKGKHTGEKKWFIKLKTSYMKFLHFVLRKRYFVFTFFVLIFVFSLFLASSNMRRFRLMRGNSSEQIYAIVHAPEGTSLEKSETYAKELLKAINQCLKKDELVSIITTVGQDLTNRFEGTDERFASFDIRLTPSNDRDRSAKDIMKQLRKQINNKRYDNYEEIIFRESRWGPSTSDAIDIKIVTDSLKDSLAVIEDVKVVLKNIKGVKDMTTDLEEGKDELRIKFNYNKLAQYGLTVSSVSSTVRTAFQGTTATYVQTPETKLDYIVKVPDKYKKDKSFLMNLIIPNSSGGQIKLRNIAYLVEGKSMATIRHYNGERSISVKADVDNSITTSTAANIQAKKMLSDISSRYPGTYLRYEGEYRQTQNALSDLAFVFILALVLIYLIVLLLFRSAGQPLVVMAVIPFGLIGVLLSFTAHGLSLDFMALIGIIGLSGVVVNDSIIMVDFINKVRKKNKDIDTLEEIVEGAGHRLRPVILTTVTTVAGLMPSVYGIGGSVESFRSTVMAMAYGLLFATTLTLIFIPSLYMIGVDVKYKFLKKIPIISKLIS